MFPRQLQEPVGLFEILARLDGDGAVECQGFEQRTEVRGPEVSTQLDHGVADPAVARGVVVPEVLMSVEPHGRIVAGTALRGKASKPCREGATPVSCRTAPVTIPRCPLNTMKIRLSLLALTLLIGALACSKGSAAAGRRSIAVIPKGTTHEFWKAIHAGAETAGRTTDCEIIWKGPLREDDRNEQIKVVETFITRRVSGIVIAPLDNTALAPVLKQADAKGIPVIVVDSDVDWDGRVSFIATDNYRGGVLGARKLAELLGGKGKVILMRYLEGSASTMKREAGFLETIQKEFPEIEVASSNQYAGSTVEGAYSTSENLLLNHGDVDGIFCPNESSAFGMLRALQSKGLAGKIKFVGFDPSEKLVQALRDGEIDALVIQDPFAMGDRGVRTMLDHLDGKPVEGRIDTGVEVITKANMQEPRMSSLLFPDLSILDE